MLVTAVLVVAVPGVPSALGQTEEQSNLDRFVFEVSSIRPDGPGGFGAHVSFGNARYEVAHVPVNELLHEAYGVEDIQLQNMPKWLSDESFTVEATIAPETMDALSRLTPDARRAARQHMLQALLADRFHLVVRQEKKELPVYVLTVAPNGPKLRPADLSNQYENGVRYPNGMVLGPRVVGYEFGSGSIKMAGQGGTIRQLVDRLNQNLSIHLQRVFLDETKIDGIYDFELDFSVPWVTVFGFIPADRDVPEDRNDSLFSAMEHQLGLKLISAKRLVPVITIEQVERPTEN